MAEDCHQLRVMHEIHIAPLGGGRFRVEVVEEGAGSHHEVTVAEETISRLGWHDTPEKLIRKSFEFLLVREGKEQILASFELSEINRYFPEYEKEIKG